MAEREYNDPGILGRLFPYFNKDIGETVDTSVEMKTNQQKPIKSGAGVDPTLVKAGVDLLSNYLSKDKTQSIPSQIPQMPQQYDTSPYRALDIIGAGIARRPTQESYFNQLEKMQNARLEDAYNRRTDTDEAKNLQGLVKQTFPNLSDDIVSKISPDYFSKNYPLLAQMAEKSTNIQNKMAKDQTAKENFKIKYQGVIPDDQLASVIPSITADNLDVYDKRYAKNLEEVNKKAQEEAQSQVKIQSDQDAKNVVLAFYPNIPKDKLNVVNASNVKDIMKKLQDDKDNEIKIQLSKKATKDVQDIKKAKEKNDIPKLTEAQTKFKIGLDRQLQGEQLFNELIKQGYDPYSRLNSPALEEQAQNAIREFIYGTLRPESGAVISQDEIDSYKRTFFGEPSLLIVGEGKKELMKQNAQRRQNAINSTKSVIQSVLPKEENLKEGSTYQDDDGRIFRISKGQKVYL